MRGSGSKKLDLPGDALKKGGLHGLEVERKAAVLESRGREIGREVTHTLFNKFLHDPNRLLLHAMIPRAAFLLTSEGALRRVTRVAWNNRCSASSFKAPCSSSVEVL